MKIGLECYSGHVVNGRDDFSELMIYHCMSHWTFIKRSDWFGLKLYVEEN